MPRACCVGSTLHIWFGANDRSRARRIHRTHRSADPRAVRHDRGRHDHVEPIRPGTASPGTVGFALPGVELRVCDGDGNSRSRPARPGWSRSAPPGSSPATGGCRTRPPPEHRAVAAGFITGDVGSVDAQGRLTLEGRSSDMIISGGYNIYPKEVEMVLDDLPGVLETGVIGVPHPDLGEAVVAVVVRDGTTDITNDELAASLDGVLARFQAPQALHLGRGTSPQRNVKGAKGGPAHRLLGPLSPPESEQSASERSARSGSPACPPKSLRSKDDHDDR